MTDFGRDELIDARREKEKLVSGMTALATVIARLMEDRVRHMVALRKIAFMTETGIAAKGGGEIHRIAREALENPADMSWWPETDGTT